MGDSPQCGEMSATQTKGTARPRGGLSRRLADDKTDEVFVLQRD